MEGLIEFIVAAKRATYAAQGDMQSVAPLLSGTKQLEYKQGDFFYRDIYAGMLNFVGQEIVYLQEKPIWSMSYAGGLLRAVDKAEALSFYAVLREAMRQVSVEHPFRGPDTYKSGQYLYTNTTEGTLKIFHGHETISDSQSPIYELFYSGGMIK